MLEQGELAQAGPLATSLFQEDNTQFLPSLCSFAGCPTRYCPEVRRCTPTSTAASTRDKPGPNVLIEKSHFHSSDFLKEGARGKVQVQLLTIILEGFPI